MLALLIRYYAVTRYALELVGRLLVEFPTIALGSGSNSTGAFAVVDDCATAVADYGSGTSVGGEGGVGGVGAAGEGEGEKDDEDLGEAHRYFRLGVGRIEGWCGGAVVDASAHGLY